jgi:tRNA A-37 threonylcarbamoyl transferase component Bud32
VTVLRARAFRSVELEPGGEPAVVVKRFHHPNPLLAPFDGARARREQAALVALHAAGLPVPRPLGLVRAARGFEVRLAAVEGARTLAESLADGGAPPGGWERLLARLGRLLAGVQAAGWEHGDLHPGNVLVDAQGAPWLIDFQRARRVPPDAARALAELVECAAVARERLAPRLRARFLVAWLRALPAGLRPALAGTALARAVESRARTRRLALVRTGLGRWLRESSRVRVLDGGARLERRDLAGEPGDALELRALRAELEARWLGAARLLEHGLPVARPARLLRGSRWLGRGAAALFEPPVAGAPSERALLDALEERGLALAAPRIALGPAGLYFLPPREPDDFADAL